MNHPKHRHILPALLLLLVACTPVTSRQFLQEGKTALSGKQLHELLDDQSLHLAAIDFNAQIRFQSNGQLVATSLKGEKQTGKCSVDSEGLVCMKFAKWYFGDQKCYTVFADKDTYVFFTANGARSYTASVISKATTVTQDTEGDSSSGFNSNFLADAGRSGATVLSDAEKKLALISLARDCPGCNFAGTDLSGAQLAGAELTGADLSGANLENINFRQAKLAGANLSGAKLSGSDLAGADLSNCNFSRADLSGANFRRANVTGAKFQDADLNGAHLEQTKGLQQ